MYLLNTYTLRLESFVNAEPGSYAILSHRWAGEEASFQQVSDLHNLKTTGAEKVIKCCELARNDGYRYCWVDTVCIDKRASAELSEAINSMYRWYVESGVCYVYMNDVHASSGDHPDFEPEFKNSLWFTRCWTLQELLAPVELRFYNSTWKPLAVQQDAILNLINETTLIHVDAVYKRKQLWEFSIAERMSWASRRHATRVEDVAYSLLGIFDCNLPMLYGEGAKAFERLQEEIIRTNSDESIFAWHNDHVPSTASPGLLATSPAQFVTCRGIRASPMKEQYQSFLKGLFQDEEEVSEILDLYEKLRSMVKHFSGSLQGYVLTNQGLTAEVLLSKLDDIHYIVFLDVANTLEGDFDTFIGLYLASITSNSPNYKRVAYQGRHKWTGTWSELCSRHPQFTRIFVQHKGFKHNYRLRKQYGFWLQQEWQERLLDSTGGHSRDLFQHDLMTETFVVSPEPGLDHSRARPRSSLPSPRPSPSIGISDNRTSSHVPCGRCLVTATATSVSRYWSLENLRSQVGVLNGAEHVFDDSEPESNYVHTRTSRTRNHFPTPQVEASLLYRFKGELTSGKRSMEILTLKSDQTGPVVNIETMSEDLRAISLIQLGITKSYQPYCIVLANDCKSRTSDKQTLADAINTFETVIDDFLWSTPLERVDTKVSVAASRRRSSSLARYDDRRNLISSAANDQTVSHHVDVHAPYRGFFALNMPPHHSKSGHIWICRHLHEDDRNYMFHASYGWTAKLENIDIFPKMVWKFDFKRLKRPSHRSVSSRRSEIGLDENRYHFSTGTCTWSGDLPIFFDVDRLAKEHKIGCSCPDRIHYLGRHIRHDLSGSSETTSTHDLLVSGSRSIETFLQELSDLEGQESKVENRGRSTVRVLPPLSSSHNYAARVHSLDHHLTKGWVSGEDECGTLPMFIHQYRLQQTAADKWKGTTRNRAQSLARCELLKPDKTNWLPRVCQRLRRLPRRSVHA